MNLTDLGFNSDLVAFVEANNLSQFSIARVTKEHKERYIVSTGDNEYEAEITGNLRFSAVSRADYPAVGDWVSISKYDADQAIIHNILPRSSVLQRQAIGKPGESQIISTNIDVAFIVQAINNNFNLNRLERYLSICYTADIKPVLILTKIDLTPENEIKKAISDFEKRDKNVKYFLLSNLTLTGLDEIIDYIQKGKTYCVVGSSGVGKSTLINNILKKNVLKTGEISLSTNKGKHITEHRELFILENGGIIIDTPGMKELGLTDDAKGIETTFQSIYDLSLNCKFPDCKHISEVGCAVLEALNREEIDHDAYNNFQKVQKEQERFLTTVVEKHKKDKQFGKSLKNYYKDIKKNED